MKINHIACAILAGGKNIRFEGKTKAHAMIGGERILDRIIRTAGDIFDEIIIITNSPGSFGDYPHLKMTGDIFKDAGPSAGIHAALKASGTNPVFIVGSDMPFVDAAIIRSQIGFYAKNSKADAVIPDIEGHKEPLHGIYSKKIVPLLESMLLAEPGFSLRDLMEKANTVYFQLPATEKVRASFLNVNTPEDMTKADELAQRLGL